MIAVDVNTNEVNSSSDMSFPAISITLEEIRHYFDFEEGRRQSLENKAGILLGVIGVVLAIVPVFKLGYSIEIIFFYVLMTIALIFGLLVFMPMIHKIPHKEYDDFYQYARMGEVEAMDNFLLNYIAATKDMDNKNNKKVIYLIMSVSLTIIAWIYISGWVLFASK